MMGRDWGEPKMADFERSRDADGYRVTRKRDLSKETRNCPKCDMEMETKGRIHDAADNWLRLLLQCPKCREVKFIKSWW